jgi:NADH-ubiquinone oxidoreductase chain 4
MFFSPLNFVSSSDGYEMGVDLIRFSLVELRIWLLILMLLARTKILTNRENRYYFIFILNSLLILLILTFICLNYLGFYFFFEGSLIPTLLIITG